MNNRKLAVLAVLVLTLSFASVARAGSAYTIGDVFVAATGVGIEEYTSAGVLVQTITDGGSGAFGSGFLTGMSFQSNGNLLVTNFSAGTIVQFDNMGNQLNGTFVTGLAAGESIAIDKAGNLYVGQANGASINEYSSTGTFIGSTAATTQDRGTDWVDLAADQKTILYTSEGTSILSVTAGGAQNTNFANGLPGSNAYALRIIPGGTFAGDVLVADSNGAYLVDATGAVIKTYTWGNNNGTDFALNIDPNGTAFWTSDVSGHVAEFDIATGALLEDWTANVGGGTYGLVVFGQQTSSGGGGGGGNVPEPGTFTLLAGGLLSLGGFAKRRLLK